MKIIVVVVKPVLRLEITEGVIVMRCSSTNERDNLSLHRRYDQQYLDVSNCLEIMRALGSFKCETVLSQCDLHE